MAGDSAEDEKSPADGQMSLSAALETTLKRAAQLIQSAWIDPDAGKRHRHRRHRH